MLDTVEKERIEKEQRMIIEQVKAELKAKQDAEHKTWEAEEAKFQVELQKGDAEKIKDLISDIANLKTKYQFKSKSNQAIFEDVRVRLNNIIQYINYLIRRER